MTSAFIVEEMKVICLKSKGFGAAQNATYFKQCIHNMNFFLFFFCVYEYTYIIVLYITLSIMHIFVFIW
jgi:hypothetical protein